MSITKIDYSSNYFTSIMPESYFGLGMTMQNYTLLLFETFSLEQ